MLLLWEAALPAVLLGISMEHLKCLERDLGLSYLELQVQKVDFVIVLLEGQSGNRDFLGCDS